MLIDVDAIRRCFQGRVGHEILFFFGVCCLRA